MQAQRNASHIVTVDFARGLMALGVMFYHLLYYERIISLPQLGSHAVYCFFVISGFSLYISYRDKLETSQDLTAYFVRRFFRIAPLYYLTLLIYVGLRGLPDTGLYGLFMNVSFVMGFANAGAVSIPTGGWSIGIEMVFYLALPLIIFVCRGKPMRVLILAGFLLFSQLAYINYTLAGTTLGGAWIAYTQPLSFIGYFTAGCAIAACLQRWPKLKGNAATFIVAALAILPFVFVERDNTVILVGWLGCALALLAILLIAAVAFMPEPTGWLRVIAIWLGRLSYPIYLLHPIIYGGFGQAAPLWMRIPVSVLMTVIAAEIISRFVESPATAFGRRLTARQSTEAAQHAA